MEGAWRLSGRCVQCVECVWMVSVRCVEGVCRVSGRCLEIFRPENFLGLKILVGPKLFSLIFYGRFGLVGLVGCR